MKQQLVKTTDGSHTIYVPELDEHYHSVHGALQESYHIFLKAGYNFCKADPLNILEVGFGTGLNAFLTAIECNKDNKKVIYTTVEKYPLEDEIVKQLNYLSLPGLGEKELFEKIHSSVWGIRYEISETFAIHKIKADLTSIELSGSYDLIYFDAFGPDKQPEMWSREMIEKISGVTCTGGVFVTYSVKGELKRNLKACGFKIDLLPGPPGKRQMLRGIKI